MDALTTRGASPVRKDVNKRAERMKTLNVEKVAAAIEADAGHPLPGLRESLAEAKAGRVGRLHTPEQISARHRASGSVADEVPQAPSKPTWPTRR